jgi:hypothetical protein
LLADLGLPGKRDVGVVSGDQAGASDLQGRAIGVVQGWTVVWDPMMFIPDGLDDFEGLFETGIWCAAVEQGLLTLSQRSRVYSFVVEGSSDSHGFAWYVNGRRRRLWLSQEGSFVMQEGPRLAEEAARCCGRTRRRTTHVRSHESADGRIDRGCGLGQLPRLRMNTRLPNKGIWTPPVKRRE